MKYRKKPIIVEAYQWDGETIEDYMDCNPTNHPLLSNNVVLKTLEGNMLIKKGDWVIKGIKGEYYVCKPDIFEMTYEKVEDK